MLGKCLDEWWQRLADAFDDRLAVAREVFWSLHDRAGVSWYDLSPRNLIFAA